LEKFNSHDLQKKLPWMTTTQISAAFVILRREARIDPIDIVFVGPKSTRAIVYERGEIFDTPRKFRKKPKPYTKKSGKTGTKQEKSPRIRALYDREEERTNKDKLLERLDELSERLLNEAQEVEELKVLVKENLII
jgi:hypothetical protein